MLFNIVSHIFLKFNLVLVFCRPCQHVLERTSCIVTPETVEVHTFTCKLFIRTLPSRHLNYLKGLTDMSSRRTKKKQDCKELIFNENDFIHVDEMVVSVLTCWRNDRRESIKLNNHIIFFQLRFTVSLPARGRTIEGHACKRILTENLPQIINKVKLENFANL